MANFNAARTTTSASPPSSSSTAKAKDSDPDKDKDTGKGKVVMSRYEDAMVVLPMVRYTKVSE